MKMGGRYVEIALCAVLSLMLVGFLSPQVAFAKVNSGKTPADSLHAAPHPDNGQQSRPNTPDAGNIGFAPAGGASGDAEAPEDDEGQQDQTLGGDGSADGSSDDGGSSGGGDGQRDQASDGSGQAGETLDNGESSEDGGEQPGRASDGKKAPAKKKVIVNDDASDGGLPLEVAAILVFLILACAAALVKLKESKKG